MAKDLPKQGRNQKSDRPTHEQIAQSAYQIFLERGSPEGHAQEHWLEAEAQLTAAAAQQQPARTNQLQKMQHIERRAQFGS